MSLKNQDLFKTADFNLVAFLLASGLVLVDAQLGPERKIHFAFEDPTRCAELARAFCSGAATVPARALIESQQRLRDLRDVLISMSHKVRL
jgi:hypothetical protein